MNAVGARPTRGRLVLPGQPPFWRALNVICTFALFLPAVSLSVLAAWWAHYLVVTPRQTRSSTSFALGPDVKVDLQFHLLRAVIFFVPLLLLITALWAVFAWYGTGRALSQPETSWGGLRAKLGALIVGCEGFALTVFGGVDRTDVSTSWVAQSGMVVLGAAGAVTALAFAWRLGLKGLRGPKGLPVLPIATAAMVLLGGLAFLADRAAPPGEPPLTSWPNGSFLAGNSDAGPGGSWTSGGFWTARWVVRQGQANLYFAASCQPSGHCLAFGSGPLGENVVVASSNGGTTWAATKVHVTASGIGSMPARASCWDSDDCLLGGLPPAMTANGGRTWRTVSATNGRFVSAVDCPAPRHCLMATEELGDKAILATDDGGKSWQSADLPPGNWAVQSISCATTTNCLAVGSTSTYAAKEAVFIWRSSDGGITWQRANFPARSGTFWTVACNAAERCFADGADARVASDNGFTYASFDGGATWAQDSAAPEGFLACARARCTVVSTGWSKPGSWVVQGKSRWVGSGLGNVAPVGVSLLGVSCADTGTCVAVGTDLDNREGVIYYTHDGGISWATARITQPPPCKGSGC